MIGRKRHSTRAAPSLTVSWLGLQPLLGLGNLALAGLVSLKDLQSSIKHARAFRPSLGLRHWTSHGSFLQVPVHHGICEKIHDESMIRPWPFLGLEPWGSCSNLFSRPLHPRTFWKFHWCKHARPSAVTGAWAVNLAWLHLLDSCTSMEFKRLSVIKA